MRILHLPDVVGGHPSALSKGERALGAKSTTLSYTRSPFDYPSEITLKHINAGFARRWSERVATFARIRNAFDIFHFNFGRSLLTPGSGRFPLAEVSYYGRDAAKVMTFQGSDARIAYEPALEESIETEGSLGHALDPSYCSKEGLAARRRASLATVERAALYCDRLLALNPDLLAAMPADKAQYFPYAIDPDFVDGLEAARTPFQSQRRAALHVVHLSTNRVLKGTGLIEQALRRARDQLGLDLTYEIIVRADRRSALSAVANADVVIDQVVLGWYGAAAVEASCLGKPVICWISERQAAAAPADLMAALPFIVTNHSGIADVLKRFAKDRALLAETGRKCQDFARTWHHPVVVARSALRIYEQLLAARGMDNVRQ